MNKFRLLPLLLVLTWQSGCISIFADRKVYLEEGKSFGGIKDDLADSVNIFITHGMGIQQDDFDAALIQGMFESMGDPAPTVLIDTSFLVNQEDSIIASYRLYESQVLQKRYRIFSLNWSRFNQPVRDYFVTPDGAGGADYDFRRNKTAAKFKKMLLTDGVIDLVRYTDPSIQEELQDAFFNIIARMFLKQPMVPNDQVASDLGTFVKLHNLRDFYFITGSLGSKVTFDAIRRVLTDQGQPPVSSPPKVDLHQYMMSNQLSFLQYIQPLPVALPDSSGIPNILATRVRSLEIVAFNDPNDFLGFYLPEAVVADSQINVVNVSLRNANGLLANPDKAHNDAKLNPKMHKMIAIGSNGVSTKSFTKQTPPNPITPPSTSN